MNKTMSQAMLAAGLLAVGFPSAYAFESKVSGQIARGVMHADDGPTSETHFVDPGPSLTRLRYRGSGELSPDLTAGILFEWEYLSNPTASVTNAAKSVAPTLAERHILVYFQGGFGRLGVGQTDGAANGVVEADLSRTDLIATPLIQAYGGAMPFRTAAGGNGPTITQTINNLDFESRYDLARYDTPKLGPVGLAVSRGVKSNQDISEAAVRFDSDIGAGGKIVARLGYSTRDAGGTTGDVVTTGGSVSWLASNGLNLTFATSQAKDDDPATPKDKVMYSKVGYIFGKHAVGLEYAVGEDQNQSGDEADLVGIGYNFRPVNWADIFAGARVYSLDRPGASFEDIRLITIGALIKF